MGFGYRPGTSSKSHRDPRPKPCVPSVLRSVFFDAEVGSHLGVSTSDSLPASREWCLCPHPGVGVSPSSPALLPAAVATDATDAHADGFGMTIHGPKLVSGSPVALPAGSIRPIPTPRCEDSRSAEMAYGPLSRRYRGIAPRQGPRPRPSNRKRRRDSATVPDFRRLPEGRWFPPGPVMDPLSAQELAWLVRPHPDSRGIR